MTVQHCVSIPENITFSDLHLHRGRDGIVRFDWSPIYAICEASGLDADTLGDDNVALLILAWYKAHRTTGGSPDASVEELIAEVDLEDRCGSMSYPPGHA